MNNKNDEIDLLDLFKNILVGLYHYINRRTKLLAIFAIVGIFIGLSIHMKNSAVYESKLISVSSINKEIIIYLIESLDKLIDSNKAELGKILELKEAGVENIKSIEAEKKEFFKDILSEGSVVNVLDFTQIEVTIIYEDTIELVNLDKKINNYLSNNKYVKKELSLNKQNLKSMLNKTDLEIKRLDSLQKNILSASLIKTDVNLGQLMLLKDKSSSSYHNDIIALENKKQGYIKRIETLSALRTVKPFDKSKTKEKSIVENIGFFFGVFFGLGFIVSIILEIRRKALEFVKKE